MSRLLHACLTKSWTLNYFNFAWEIDLRAWIGNKPQNVKITFEELIKKQTSLIPEKEFTNSYTQNMWKVCDYCTVYCGQTFLAKGLLTINHTTYTTFSSFKASLRRFSYTWLILRQSIKLTEKKLIKDFHVSVKVLRRIYKM